MISPPSNICYRRGRDASPLLNTTRRAVIGAAAASLFSPPAHSTAPDPPPLKAIAARKGRIFGAAMQQAQIEGDVALTQTLLRECAWFTPEIEMKWAALEPQEGQFDFAAMDALANFARRHGCKLRGHTLLWHGSVPAWAAQRLKDKPDWALLSRLFAEVMPRYGDVVAQWDVVN